MLGVNKPASLSRLLAVRMASIAALLSLILMLIFLLYFLSDERALREQTLSRSAQRIAEMLSRGEDPSGIALYRDFPQSYGFRVFAGRSLANRRVLASSNTGWLQALLKSSAQKGRDQDPARDRRNLEEGFTSVDGTGAARADTTYILVDRIVVGGQRYWIQAFMRGDPGWAAAGVISKEVLERVIVPVLFIVPVLTLAMFLMTRRALVPLQELTKSARSIGSAMARGQLPMPLTEKGLLREFADVSAAINAVLAGLGRSLISQRQFIADAAHELRTPLAILLLEVAQLPPDERRERLKDDLKKLGDLVSELLRFAQAEEILSRTRERVDVTAIAKKVASDAAVTAVSREQLIEFNRPESPVEMAGNATLVEIAIRNLVDNALKYSPSRTTVTVSIGPGPDVIVEDQGPGIPPSQRDTIFERFWRGDPQLGNGAGIGLVLVRRIAELHEGDVSVESRSPVGSRFVLKFRPSLSEAGGSLIPGEPQ